MLTAITGLISTGITAWSARSRQKANIKSMELTAQSRLKMAQVEAQIKQAESGDNAAINLDLLSYQHRGWKDEYLLIFTTAPVLILFTAPLIELWLISERYQAGDLTDAVMAGFTALNQTPDWYLGALLLVFVDTLGFRRLLRGLLESKLHQMVRK